MILEVHTILFKETSISELIIQLSSEIEVSLNRMVVVHATMPRTQQKRFIDQIRRTEVLANCIAEFSNVNCRDKGTKPSILLISVFTGWSRLMHL